MVVVRAVRAVPGVQFFDLHISHHLCTCTCFRMVIFLAALHLKARLCWMFCWRRTEKNQRCYPEHDGMQQPQMAQDRCHFNGHFLCQQHSHVAADLAHRRC